MLVLDYLYYTLYCLTTIYRKPDGAEARAVGAFAITFTFNFFNLLNIAAIFIPADTKNQVPLKMFICLAFCLAYFALNKRAYKVANILESRYGYNRKLHAAIGGFYFIASIVLFIYTATYMKK